MKRLLFGIIFLSAALIAKKKSQFKEGLWEYRVKVELPGSETPEMTFQHCAKKEDYIPQTQAGSSGECKEVYRKFDGKTATWQLDCFSEGQKSKVFGKATYLGNEMDALMTIETAQGKITQKIKGTYKGACL